MNIMGVFFNVKTKILGIVILCLCFSSVLAINHSWDRTNPGGGGTMGMVGATKDGTIIAVSDLSGVYRQTMDEKRWEPLGGNNGLPGATALGFHPGNAATFFVGTGNGLYRTQNGGVTTKSPDVKFKLVLGGVDEVGGVNVDYIESIVVAKNNTVYVAQHLWGGASEVYKSQDGGDTWNKVNNLPGTDSNSKSWNIMKLVVHPKNEKIIYALTGESYHSCSAARLFRSIDAGDQWIQIAKNLSVAPGGEAAENDILDMDVHPIEQDTVFVSTYKESTSCVGDEQPGGEAAGGNQGAFYQSTDGGASFTALTDKSGIISVGFDSQPTIRLVDIFTSTDWDDNDGDIKWGVQSGAWESLYPWTSWNRKSEVKDWDTGNRIKHYFTYGQCYFGLSKQLTKDLFNADRIYGAFGQASLDGGRTFKNIHSKSVAGGWLSSGIENIVGHALDINETNSKKVYMGGYDLGFWRSQDGGGSWNRSQPDVYINPEYLGYSWWNAGSKATAENGGKGDGSNISFILSDPARENVVWASFGKGQSKSDMEEEEGAKRGLFKSTDAGKTWTLMSGNLPEGSNTFMMYGLSLDINSDRNSRTLYMTVNGKIYKSTDDGSNWSIPPNSPTGMKFTAVDTFNGNLVYAGGEKGLYRSIDAGTHWDKVSPDGMQATSSHTPMREDIVPTEGRINWDNNGMHITLYPWEGVFNIQTDPHVPNRIYVGAHGKGKGLWKSDNKGDTWEKLLDDDHLRGVAIAPQDSNIIYATSSDNYHSGRDNLSYLGERAPTGIQYSLKGGEKGSWLQANDGMAWNTGGLIEVEMGKAPKVWAWSPGVGVQHSALPAQIDACNISASTLSIPSNKWRQLSLPCAPPTTAQTVQAIFGDDLLGTYRKDWTVYAYDSVNNSYAEMGLESTLAQGVGYWVFHTNNAGVASLDMPTGSTQTTPVESCKSVNGKKCFRIPLITQAGSVQWNMSGYPFLRSIPLSDLRVVTKKGSVCASGCTLDGAKSNNIVENRLWSYSGEKYEVIQGNTPLNAWKGAWVAVLEGGDGLEPTLEIPAE